MSCLSFLGLHSFRHAHHMNKWFHSQGVGLDDWPVRPTSFHVILCFYNYSVWSSKRCQNYKYVCKYCNNKLVYVIILIIYCIYVYIYNDIYIILCRRNASTFSHVFFEKSCDGWTTLPASRRSNSPRPRGCRRLLVFQKGTPRWYGYWMVILKSYITH